MGFGKVPQVTFKIELILLLLGSNLHLVPKLSLRS
jgi:hypothetical protein